MMKTVELNVGKREQESSDQIFNSYGKSRYALSEINDSKFKKWNISVELSKRSISYQDQRVVALEEQLEYMKYRAVALEEQLEYMKYRAVALEEQLEYMKYRAVELEKQRNIQMQDGTHQDRIVDLDGRSGSRREDQMWLDHLFEQSEVVRKKLESDCGIDSNDVVDTAKMDGFLSEYADKEESSADLVRAARDRF